LGTRFEFTKKERVHEKGAAMLAKKLMPDVDVTIIRKEERFIVR